MNNTSTINKELSGNDFEQILNQAGINFREEVTSSKQIALECKFTNFAKNLIDFGNKYCLKNFSLNLTMDCNNLQSVGHDIRYVC